MQRAQEEVAALEVEAGPCRRRDGQRDHWAAAWIAAGCASIRCAGRSRDGRGPDRRGLQRRGQQDQRDLAGQDGLGDRGHAAAAGHEAAVLSLAPRLRRAKSRAWRDDDFTPRTTHRSVAGLAGRGPSPRSGWPTTCWNASARVGAGSPRQWPRRWRGSAIANAAATSARTRCARPARAARDAHLLRRQESPRTGWRSRQTTGYRGLYFVLQGRLSPLDGIGPRRARAGPAGQTPRRGEVVERSSPPIPRSRAGDRAYLAQLARAHGVRASQLAHGVPLGGELEYVDRGTLSHAFGSRSDILP